MSNLNISPRNNQEKNKYNSYRIAWLLNRLSEYEGPVLDLENRRCTKNHIKVIQQILKYHAVYEHIFVAHQTIADAIGTCRETVLEALHFLADLGLIQIIKRKRYETCAYKLTSFFHQKDVQWELRELLPNLYWSFKSLVRRCKAEVDVLLGRLRAANNQNPTLLFNNKKNKYKIQKTDHTKPEKEREIVYLPPDEETHNKNFNEFAAILGISV